MNQLFMERIKHNYQPKKLNLKYFNRDLLDGAEPEIASAVAAALIGFAGSAIEPTSKAVTSVFNSRGYHVNGIQTRFKYKNPPIRTEVIEVVQELKISLSTGGVFDRTNNVYFKIVSITDGFSILSTSVNFLPGKSDIMTPDSFSLSFRAVKLTGSIGADLRLKLQFVNGRYDPIGFGDYDFGGSLVISADLGRAELKSFNNPDQVQISLKTISPFNLSSLIRTRQQHMKNSLRPKPQVSTQVGGVGTTSTPTATGSFPKRMSGFRSKNLLPSIRSLAPALGVAVFFRSGSSRLKQSTQQEIMNWVAKLPGQIIHAIRNGSYPVKLIGYASSDGSLASNLRLSQRRAKSVAKFLKNQLGQSLNIQIASRGEIFPSNSTLKPSLQRKVEIRIA